MNETDPKFVATRMTVVTRKFECTEGEWRETPQTAAITEKRNEAGSKTKLPQIGPKRRGIGGTPGGAYVLLAGEWQKILRWAKTTAEGRRFLALTEAEQEKYYHKLALTAHKRTDRTLLAVMVASKQPYPPGWVRRSRKMYEAHMRRWIACADEFPQVTKHALKRFRARIEALNEMPSDFIEATLGYFCDSEGEVTRDPGGLSAEARRGLHLLRRKNGVVTKRVGAKQTSL